jgi:polar amino acid transport system ATP-binding protein
MDPDVMLFDEPTSALDPETIGEVLNVMKSSPRRHDDGGRHARDVVRAARGRLGRGVRHGTHRGGGPPRQIFEAPTTDRTRDFLSHLGWSG